ncbi:Autoinducer 2-binding protein LsrB [Pandoraea terrae]|uniref:Autoinducer 2-binding protein LsrB n=1 Tax=Pandoraea terrae TaxID=1537710 RepID=A0A5E4WFZ8_9BURK|nr:substrate-binding domain-containing protein [Pandoraea terrae]VVE23043.1 Autoinducer 2-binding protein LsrB [Pandoraea terrae]
MSRYLKALATALLLMAACVPLTASAEAKYRVVIMPKLVGISYYDAVKEGIDEAAGELPQMQVIWSGPSQNQVEKQIEMIEKIIPTRPDVIAVAANDPVAIAPVLKKARAAGIHVMSWDGDTKFREFFVNLVNFDEFGKQIVEAMKDEVGPNGEIAIVTTSFAAPNQSSWIQAIKRHIYLKYPGLKLVDIRPAGESTEESYRITQDYLKAYPSLKGIIALGVPNLPGVAKAVKDAGVAGKIAVVGNSTPNLMRNYLKDGTVKTVVLWNARDHGYLTTYCAYRMATGALKPGVAIKAGRLGTFMPVKDAFNMQIALPVMIFTKENVDKYHF